MMIHYGPEGFTETPIGFTPDSPAFKFGAGFFETLYFDGRQAARLPEHLARITASLNEFGIEHETCDFPSIIRELAVHNGMIDTTGRINIYYMLDRAPAVPRVMLWPYAPNDAATFSLKTMPPEISPLWHHKTTNRMHHHFSMAKAHSLGYDDALYVHENTVFECSVSAIVFSCQGRLITPNTPYILPSTALAAACELIDIEPAEITLQTVQKCEHAWILNSLRGMRPVLRIDDTGFEVDESHCSPVSTLIRNPGTEIQ